MFGNARDIADDFSAGNTKEYDSEVFAKTFSVWQKVSNEKHVPTIFEEQMKDIVHKAFKEQTKSWIRHTTDQGDQCFQVNRNWQICIPAQLVFTW